ncbi:hypothetical protein [Celerinatantimonas sp. MCCC 1A17872]|uniref:Rz1-like lysis system protein LysC n=1 Tax=Celerinatantimonas sp. MCCC 1A17872 TaxID=3177514 RepID=UPI0038C773E1
MKIVLSVLFLGLLIGCTTRTRTELVTQYKTNYLKPPAALLVPCEQPYFAPPKTYGDAVLRDPVWLAAFAQCQFQIEVLRECYLQADTPEQFGVCLKRFGAANPIQSGESSRVNRLAALPINPVSQ